jgi:hypothetical protein
MHLTQEQNGRQRRGDHRCGKPTQEVKRMKHRRVAPAKPHPFNEFVA